MFAEKLECVLRQAGQRIDYLVVMTLRTPLVILFIVITSSAFAQYSRLKKDTVYGFRASVGLKVAGTISHLSYSGKGVNPGSGESMPADYGTKVNVFPAVVLQFVNRKPYTPVSYDLQLSFRNPGSFKADNGVTSPADNQPRYEYTVAAKYVRLEFGARYLFMTTSAVRPYVRPLIGVQYTAGQSTKTVATGSSGSVGSSFVKISKVGFAAGLSAGVSTKYVDFELGYDFSRVPVKLPVVGRFSYDLGADYYKTIYFGAVVKPFM
jgi:hypothetical protein